jgi:hypothetical protein
MTRWVTRGLIKGISKMTHCMSLGVRRLDEKVESGQKPIQLQTEPVREGRDVPLKVKGRRP